MCFLQRILHCCCIGLLALQARSSHAVDEDIVTIHISTTPDFWRFGFHRTGLVYVYYGALPTDRAESEPGLVDVENLWNAMQPYMTDDPKRIPGLQVSVSGTGEFSVSGSYVNDLEPFKELFCQVLCVVVSSDPEHFKKLLTEHPILGMEGLADLLSSKADSAERIEWTRPPISNAVADRPRAPPAKTDEAESDATEPETVANPEPPTGDRVPMRTAAVLIGASLAVIYLAIWSRRKWHKTRSHQ